MKSLNFVHIPKTGGRHLTAAVLPYLTMALRDNGLDPRDCLNYSHTNWPVLDKDDRVVLTYRYPPRHSVSEFFYFRPWLVDDNPENGRSVFMNAVCGSEGEKIFNFQTKFICSVEAPDSARFFSDTSYDTSLLKSRLDATIIFVDGDDLSPEKVLSVYRESCRFFDLEPQDAGSLPVIYTPEFALEYSGLVYDLLTDEELSWLEEKNDLDMKLYREISNY